MADKDNVLNYEGLELYDAILKNYCTNQLDDVQIKHSLSVGENLTNNYNNQLVIGKRNVSGDYAQIIGGGGLHTEIIYDESLKWSYSVQIEQNALTQEYDFWIYNGSQKLCKVFSLSTNNAITSDMVRIEQLKNFGDPISPPYKDMEYQGTNLYFIGFYDAKFNEEDMVLQIVDTDNGPHPPEAVYYIALWSQMVIEVDSNRNLLTIDWNGNAIFAGNVYDKNGISITEAYYNSGASSIADLSDVKLYSFSDYQTLLYDCYDNKWYNDKLSLQQGIKDVYINDLQDGDILKYDAWGYDFVNTSLEATSKESLERCFCTKEELVEILNNYNSNLIAYNIYLIGDTKDMNCIITEVDVADPISYNITLDKYGTYKNILYFHNGSVITIRKAEHPEEVITSLNLSTLTNHTGEIHFYNDWIYSTPIMSSNTSPYNKIVYYGYYQTSGEYNFTAYKDGSEFFKQEGRNITQNILCYECSNEYDKTVSPPYIKYIFDTPTLVTKISQNIFPNNQWYFKWQASFDDINYFDITEWNNLTEEYEFTISNPQPYKAYKLLWKYEGATVGTFYYSNTLKEIRLYTNLATYI